MIRHIKRHIKGHYQRLSLGHKAVFGGIFLLGIMFSLFSSIFADSLPFESQLPTMFSSMGFNTGNFSEAHFAYGGNNYAGVIFWLSGEQLSTPQSVTVNGGAQTISCSEQLRGVYYNNMRGWRLWPLDASGLDILQTQGSGYGAMSLTGGFYTNCTGVLGGGYTPLSNQIYGSISHTWSGMTMTMVAGVTYNFVLNTINAGSLFSGTLATTGSEYSGWMRDTYGGIAEISSGQSYQQSLATSGGMCDGFALAPTAIYTGSNITFTCSGHSVTGYTLTGYILTITTGVGFTPVYTGQSWTTNSSETWITGNALPIGTYVAACAILSNQGVGPQCGNNLTFSVVASGSCSNNFQGNVVPSNALLASGVSYFSATTGIILNISATEPVIYTITGNFTTTPLIGSYLGTNYSNMATGMIYLSNTNAWNNIYSSFSTGVSCNYTEALRRIYVDTLAPTTPVVTASTGVCSTGSTVFSRTASVDSGVGLSGYHYTLLHASGTSYVGRSTTTGITLPQNMLLGNYTWSMQAVDLLGNTSPTVTGAFTVSPNYCGLGSYGTGIQIIGTLSSILNANIDTVYGSEIFYIRGLTGSTLLSIDRGTLIINGTGIGTTGMITSQNALQIELVSSDEYDTKVTSTISVAGITGAFSVTTKSNSCNLSRSQKLAITRVYGLLKDQYDGDTSLINDFLATFQSMLHDEVDITEDCNLDYLLDLINDDLDGLGVDTSNHIAPNCKEYQISYNNDERAYYSPMMKNRYYFINRETLIRHIDFYNAGDCHINTYGNVSWSDNRNTDSIHVAPNGKIYHLQSAGGGYTSTEFVGSKYFSDFNTMTSYIDSKNPATDVRDHQVDRTFTPITYLAPNSKEYRIYKTNRGYMSYRLMKVRYFTSLAELQSYINKNNPSR